MYNFLKRVFDVLLGVVAGLLLLLPMLVIALLIRVTSPGPAIHWSRRVGIDNSEFRMAKFRSMRIDTPQVATHLMQDSGSYVTPVGGFLRRTSLDELPQVINILRGDLSFVGPRPALYNQDDLIEARTEKGVHRIVPGLTGWAQVSGRDELPIPVKVQHDVFYLNNRSLWLDLRILFLTFVKVVQREGVSH